MVVEGVGLIAIGSGLAIGLSALAAAIAEKEIGAAAVGAMALSIDSPKFADIIGWKISQHNPSKVTRHRNHKKKMQKKMAQRSKRRNRK